MRVVAGVEYDGGVYHGWQNQCAPLLDTIQLRCENALSQIANHPITVTCAGRTDKGVHALEQVIHFDTTAERNMQAWVNGANRYLPADIRLLWATVADNSFHARYSALARCYSYILYNASLRPALWQNKVSWYPISLNIQAMIEGAQFLLGEHDFSAFRGADCQAKSTIRRIDYLELQQIGSCIILQIQANAFLHHMVRNIVGVLIAVGKGQHEPNWVQEVLLCRQRSKAGITAPAEGLYLTKVVYPEKWGITTRTSNFFHNCFA